MSESDLNVLERQNNEAIATLLNSINTTVTQAPPPTQVEDAEKTIIVQEANKTIRFKLDVKRENKDQTNWPRRKARRDHTDS
jgi:hypothetical protein